MGNVLFACRRYNLKTIKIHGRSSHSSSVSNHSSSTNTASSADFQEWLNQPLNPSSSSFSDLSPNRTKEKDSSKNSKEKDTTKSNKREIYIEEGELGSGGFSTVLLATRVTKDLDGKTNSTSVAIKRIICSDPDQIENARREIEITKKISSPFVISLYNHGERRSSKNKSNQIVSLVFPVYSNGTLWDYLIKLENEKKGGLSKEQKQSFCHGLLKGLKRIHMLNIAHCDLKTSNVLIKEDLKTPIIIDFGSATMNTLKEVKTSNQSTQLLDWASEHCTACYRAPELFDIPYPTSIDLRSCDIWSIGCCIRALTHFKGPLDEIWLKGDSLGLAVQSINKYIGKYENEEDSVYKEIVEKSLLASSNQTRPSVDELLKMLDGEGKS